MGQPQKGGKAPIGSPKALFGLGFEIAVPIVLLMYVGYRLDGWWETTPWLFLVGAILGIAIGFYNFFKRVLPPRKGPNGERG